MEVFLSLLLPILVLSYYGLPFSLLYRRDVVKLAISFRCRSLFLTLGCNGMGFVGRRLSRQDVLAVGLLADCCEL